MKKLFITIIIIFILLGAILFNHKKNNKQNNNLTQITVAEVAHSIFYAPFYVAIENNYFQDENIDIDLILTSGADNVTSAVLSKDAQIGFSGSEATIYVYNNGNKDYLQTFAGLTKKDGSFLVSRKKIDNFTLDDLKGKYVIGGRAGGMPEMTFEWTLKEHGIDPTNDLNIDTSIAFAAMEGAFIGGTGDFVTLFEPNATNIEKQGLGYIVASIGDLGGEVPYTAFNATKSFIKDNPEIIKSFTKAINKGLKYVESHNSSDIANVISKQFPDTSLNDLITIIDRYKTYDTWKNNISITEEEWNHLCDIIKKAGIISENPSYNDLIYTKYFNE